MNKKTELTAIQQYTQKWLSPFRFDYFITLGFDRDVSRQLADKQVSQLLSRFNRIVFPPRSGIPTRLNTFAVLEHHASGRLHPHILVGGPVPFPFDEAREIVRKIWMSSKPEYRKQVRHLKSRGGDPRRIAFTVPNAAPKPDKRGLESWFSPVCSLPGLAAYLTKESERQNPTELFSYKNIHLDILA